MFKYQNDNPENFRDKYDNTTYLPCTVLVFLQLGVALTTEMLNILLIIDQDSIKDIIMNFV